MLRISCKGIHSYNSSIKKCSVKILFYCSEFFTQINYNSFLMRGVGNSLFTIAMGLDQICYNIIFEITYLFLAMVCTPRKTNLVGVNPREHRFN